MKKTRFTEEQMVTILREADQRPVPEVAKKNGVSAQTLYAWRKHFGTLEPADVKRLRQLEQENGRLKKMVADRDLEIDVLKEITRKKWELCSKIRRGLVGLAWNDSQLFHFYDSPCWNRDATTHLGTLLVRHDELVFGCFLGEPADRAHHQVGRVAIL